MQLVQRPQPRALASFALVAAGLTSAASAQIGSTYCMAAPNSTGSISMISATGSTDVALNDVTLAVASLPLNQFGLFVTSQTQAFTPNPGGSNGNLCVGGMIGRFNAGVVSSGATGMVSLALDLNAIPAPMGAYAVMPGDTVNFQFWHRDVAAPGFSNLSEGLEVQFDGSTPPGMVAIPAGTFMMGSNATSGPPYYGGSSTQPVHQVTISSSFWMGQHEVTQAEYTAVMGSNPAFFPGASRPVELVSWNDALAYCAALNAQSAGTLPPGYHYRLPTEAEWEYACRAGTTTEFHYGPELFCNQGRFWESYHSNSSCGVTFSDGTAPVGSYAPNAFGLYDMHGNVWEWTLDSYAGYNNQAVTDPFVTGGSLRVYRGGSWRDSSSACRSAGRRSIDPGYRNFFLGFRVVLAPVLVP